MKLPHDMFKQDLLPYLTVDDIVNLDNACMNHKYRYQIMENISGVILLGDKDECMKASLFKWLGMRQIYFINMNFDFEVDDDSFSFSIENDYEDQFRYTQYLILRGAISDYMAVFMISHCPCLLSMDISKSIFILSNRFLTDYTLQSIAEHCTGLQSLTLNNCGAITDAGIISISIHCTRLQSLSIGLCNQLTDASIISISEKCTGLKELDVSWMINITDASLIAIAKNCTGLQYLRTYNCYRLSSKELRDVFKSVSELRTILLIMYPSLPI